MIPVAWIKLYRTLFQGEAASRRMTQARKLSRRSMFETAPRSTKCMHNPEVPGGSAAQSRD